MILFDIMIHGEEVFSFVEKNSTFFLLRESGVVESQVVVGS